MISVVEKSGDTKLSPNGGVSATWAPQSTCPTSCPLLGAGCYAETGRSGFQTRRLNRVAKGKGRQSLAEEEARKIGELTGLRKLRVHVVGDCATPESASIIGRAMRAHERKHGKAAWTYTHAWKTVPKAAWKGAKVLASCHSITDVKEARKKGFGTALVVPPHPTNKVYELGGEKIIPCPAQFLRNKVRTVTCEDCTLCQRPEFLRREKLTIGFEADRGTAKKMLTVLQEVA